jgi:hypothetical protein
MHRREFKSDADYYRAHREAFTLALELGCTPAEAELELATRRSRERWRAAQQRLDRKSSAAPAPRLADNWNAPWMHRD